MSKMFLRCLGVRGYCFRTTRFRAGEARIQLWVRREELCCSKCQSKRVRVLEWNERTWQTVPVGSRSVFLVMQVPKVECQECFARTWTRVSFAEPHRRHTRGVTAIPPADVEGFENQWTLTWL